MPSEVSKRACTMKPFRAMEVLAEARKLERQGRSIVHMELGEPDLPEPPHVTEAAIRALEEGFNQYTPAEGLIELREAIARRYLAKYGVTVDPDRILVTMGASPAYMLLWSALLEPGDEVIVSRPRYACFSAGISFFGGVPREVTLREDEGYAWRPDEVRRLVGPRTRAILVNSPANPTGCVIDSATMTALADAAGRAYLVSDEIYHDVEYGAPRARSALEFTDRAFVIDGFSKRHCMTGYRIGWLVMPPEFVPAIRCIHQNYFICASSFVQKAALAALDGPDDALRHMIEVYAERRRLVIDRLRSLGFRITVEPQGAFYVLAGLGDLAGDATAFASRMLHEAGVAATPGEDFAQPGAIRFSYATAIEDIRLAMDRLAALLGGSVR